MNRDERHVMNIFDDASMQIDPKFRSHLGRQLAAGGGPSKTRQVTTWLRFALVPAALLLAIASISLTEFGGREQPFQPQKVSAEELIRKSDAAAAAAGENKHNFVISMLRTTPGPRLQTCGYDQMLGPGNRSVDMYVFKSSDSPVEAYYSRIDNGTVGIESGLREIAVYDESEKEVMDAKFIPEPSSLSQVMNSKLFGFEGSRMLDLNGKQLTEDTLQSEMRNGREVFQIIADSTTPIDESSECADVLVHVVLDARTYNILETGAYVGSVREENRIYYTLEERQLQTITPFQALQIMQKAGFDKSKAASSFEAGL